VDPRRRLAELMAFREPLYRGTAHVVVATDGRRVQTVADEVLAALGALGFVASAPAEPTIER